jgi:hypothetical protein
MRLLTGLSVVALVGGFLLALTGAGVIPGILLILLGLGLGALLGAVALTRRARDAVNEWRSLVAGGGPQSVRIVRFEPPQGFIFNRDATVTLEIEGQDGTKKQVERSFPVPPPQAFAWRVAGWIPLPLRKLAGAHDLSVPLYRKRGSRARSS